jgi:hemin uptake protein HemP
MKASPRLSCRLPVEPGQRPCPPEVVPADVLFQGSQEVLIRHNGGICRLRITRNGKLILTK